jgi:glycosyltransferase involved in cell wall biosynthesis
MSPNSDELKALYHRCDIFCLPTYGDCLPMVLSEAGAAGLPAISTRVAGIPEIIRDHETGRLVAVGDAAALTEVLKELILRPEVRLRQGAQAANVVSRDFDAVQNTSRLLALLKQMSQK